ncbi:MAG TPA: hypothetical protein VMU18_05395, partial [Rhodoblastus sp.]|nr:hypothetical protein [Rhodoblastus sp.]
FLVLSQNAPLMTRVVDGGTLAADAATLSFPAPALPSGDYFVRVMVDGAQSALATGVGGQPVGPLVNL